MEIFYLFITAIVYFINFYCGYTQNINTLKFAINSNHVYTNKSNKWTEHTMYFI